jgi:hypothetical protein
LEEADGGFLAFKKKGGDDFPRFPSFEIDIPCVLLVVVTFHQLLSMICCSFLALYSYHSAGLERIGTSCEGDLCPSSHAEPKSFAAHSIAVHGSPTSTQAASKGASSTKATARSQASPPASSA